MSDHDWRCRERLRMEDGTYELLPDSVIDAIVALWDALPDDAFSANRDLLEGTYVHMSKTRPYLVAYTENDVKGYADKQTIAKLGTYISKFWPDTKPEAISRIVALFKAEAAIGGPLEILTGDALVEAYKTGPASCMKKDAFPGLGPEQHPSEVYATAEGVGLAVLRDTNGRVNARCIINMKTKTYSRSYGYGGLLEVTLANNGYTYSVSCLEGVKLPLIWSNKYPGAILMPYIDGDAYCVDVDIELGICTISDEGYYSTNEHSCDVPPGILASYYMPAELVQCMCVFCDNYVQWRDAEDVTRVGDFVCRECLEQHFVRARVGGSRMEYIRTEDAEYYEDTYYDREALDAYGLVVTCDGEAAKLEDVIEYNDAYYLIADLDTYDLVMTIGGGVFTKDDTVEHDGKTYAKDELEEYGLELQADGTVFGINEVESIWQQEVMHYEYTTINADVSQTTWKHN